MIGEMEGVLGRKLSDEDGTHRTNDDIKYLAEVAEHFRIDSVTDPCEAPMP